MVWAKLYIYNIVIWLIISPILSIQAEKRLNNTQISFNESQTLNILPGIKCLWTDSELIVDVKIQDLLQETKVQSSRQARKKKKEHPLKKLAYMLMMAPIVWQVLSLPGAVASVKMSLLKSIMVAKLAIVLMIYNYIRSTQHSEVVVHKKLHHYRGQNNYPIKDEEDEWFGR
ncbi:uncharacterized protein LOC114944507 [Nylanderia fulva]|uniref:uncharacterized protein LOC114944507 n=1 Tax=Nylanderia fulva TaxID=613905 RepID=UPI0010FBB6D4|nr:uncharacterized protein LOC114944507 [Nylanderia fulva]